jgi:hypothetical protein
LEWVKLSESESLKTLGRRKFRFNCEWWQRPGISEEFYFFAIWYLPLRLRVLSTLIVVSIYGQLQFSTPDGALWKWKTACFLIGHCNITSINFYFPSIKSNQQNSNIPHQTESFKLATSKLHFTFYKFQSTCFFIPLPLQTRILTFFVTTRRYINFFCFIIQQNQS